MTSSLVGSEMCIRDRFATCWWWARAARIPPTRGPTFSQSLKRRAAGWTPVSYTHLTLPTICSV
eukprot:8684010-Prorocentrum_lima.AAC.1